MFSPTSSCHELVFQIWKSCWEESQNKHVRKTNPPHAFFFCSICAHAHTSIVRWWQRCDRPNTLSVTASRRFMCYSEDMLVIHVWQPHKKMNLALPWLAYCMSILKYECKNEHMIKDIVSRVITIHNSERDPGGHWCLMCSHIRSVCVCETVIIRQLLFILWFTRQLNMNS